MIPNPSFPEQTLWPLTLPDGQEAETGGARTTPEQGSSAEFPIRTRSSRGSPPETQTCPGRALPGALCGLSSPSTPPCGGTYGLSGGLLVLLHTLAPKAGALICCSHLPCKGKCLERRPQQYGRRFCVVRRNLSGAS
jgi:hypothetical protein